MGKDILTLRKFVAPEIIFGQGAVDLAGRYASNLSGGRVLVVTDPGVISAGWCKRITDSLEENGVEYSIFSKVSENPRDSEIMAGASMYAQCGCSMIVAVGGGSPMDCAKGIGVVCTNGGNILEYEGVDNVGMPIPPLVCVPTTGGTSADISQFSIVLDTGQKVKKAIISKAIVPDVALIDPQTLTSMSSYLTACTGMDALVHAIEALVSNASSILTDVHALKAIELISQNLVKSIEEPENLEYRAHVMLGSLEAGLAFSNASLGAVHAMAHSLGGLLDLPHGECNAILLPHVVDYNFPVVPDKFARVLMAMGVANASGDTFKLRKTAVDFLLDMKSKVGITNRLSDVGVSYGDLKTLSEFALCDPCMLTNPRNANQKDIESVYGQAF